MLKDNQVDEKTLTLLLYLSSVLVAVQPYHDVLLVLVFVLWTVCQNLFDGKDKALLGLGLDLGLRQTV